MSEQGVRDGLAADLDALEPGPELVAALESVSPDTLSGEDLAAYVRGCARVNNRGTVRLLEGIHHLGRAQAGRTERRPVLDEFSGDEVAVALGLSRQMSARRLDLADDLVARLPAVGEAMWEGRLDEAKAARFCEWTRDLCDDHARHVAQVLLPEAPSIPVAELIRRIEATATALDPDWAKRREARAVKNTRVILSANPSGSATFSVRDTSAPRGLAMRDRCDAVAAAVRALGVRIPIGDVRAEVASRLLDGSVAGLDDEQITLLLASEYDAAGRPASDESEDRRPDDDADDGPGDDGGPDDGGPDDDGPDDDGPADPDPDPDPDPESDGSDTDLGERDAKGQGLLDLPGVSEPGQPDDEAADPPVPAAPPTIGGPDPGPGRPRSGTSELRLRLTTALGLDQMPATVPGYGTVLAHHARALLTRAQHGEWRIVLTDDHGHLRHVLLARRRPRPPGPRVEHQPPRGAARQAIVELQVPTTLLAALDPHAHPAWTALLRELRARLADLGRPGPPRGSPADHRRRSPSAEIDHTRDWAHDGPSAHWNLGVLDKHHHRAKHVAGWQIRQPRPGHFTIRTRAGQHLTTTPPKILEDLPEPRPAHRPRPLPDDGWRTDPRQADAEDAYWRHQFLQRTEGRAGRTSSTKNTTTPPVVHDPDDPPPF
ncbi:DUF222 domain-containing protein [Actinomycetospora rhizophila]|uniref:DUF222 domain-containing protein n=1 Tax=Actinomycetospora rhizophila TaxID=1416876 RepID=A0ABV9Z9Y5_9PSEU